MPEVRYGVVEELGAEIGFTATASLIDWFGGGNLYVPTEATEEHPIGKVIGMPAFRRLVKWFDGRVYNERLLWVPLGYQREIDRRDRMIAVLFAKGAGTKEIMAVTHMSERHVQQVRRRVEEMGVLPLILRDVKLPVEKVTADMIVPKRKGAEGKAAADVGARATRKSLGGNPG